MDLEARAHWVEFSKAKDRMLAVTDTEESPWYMVDADLKRNARLNCITHLLSMFPYESKTPEPLKLPPLAGDADYVRPPMSGLTFVPEVYPGKASE
jgi:lysozyme family protein